MCNIDFLNITQVDFSVLHNSRCKVKKTGDSDSEIETLSSSFNNISIMESINKLKSTGKEIVEEITDCILLNDLEYRRYRRNK